MERRQAEAEIVSVWNNLIDPRHRRARAADGNQQRNVVRDCGQQRVAV